MTSKSLIVQSTPYDEKNDLKSESYIPYPGIYLKDNFIYVMGEKGNEFRVANDIKLIDIYENIDTGEVSLVLLIKYKGSAKVIEIPKNQLKKNKILDLMKYGYEVTESNATFILYHIFNQEYKCAKKLTHSSVGFGTYNNKPIFKHSKAIGIDSTYCGELKIKPKGSFEKWMYMIKNYVMKYVPLQLALIIGFAASIIGFIGGNLSLGTLLVHIYNDSTKGKTTALMLALSPFGCPDNNDGNSLAKTYSATENYLISGLSGNFGIPIGIDEASMSGNNKDFTTFVYRLSSNKDKGRLNKDSTVKQIGEWLTAIISTGEFSILAKCYENQGLRMRTIELGNIDWTPDAKTSEIIKKTVLHNYGHAGKRFARRLLKLGKKNVIKIWRKWRKKVKDTMPDADKNPFADRTSAKLATIMVAAEIAGSLFDLNFNIDEILRILVESETHDEEFKDLGTRAYEYFIQQFNKHRRHFGTPEIYSCDYFISRNQHGSKSTSVDIWGTTHISSNKKLEIRILTEEFKRIMNEGGFQDHTIILKSWKEKKLLNCEKDRLTRKIKLGDNGTVVPVYCIIANNELDDEGSEASTNHIPKAKSTSRVRKQKSSHKKISTVET